MTRPWSIVGLLGVALIWSPIPARAQATSASDRYATDVNDAEAAALRGNRADAEIRARRIASLYEQQGARSSAEHSSAGRAYLLLSNGNAGAVRSALSAFDRAVAADSGNLDPQRRIGFLFLEKYNAPEARASFELVLRRAGSDADALLGLAQVEEFEGKDSALSTARRALTAAPASPRILSYVARLHLDAEAFDSANTLAERAIRADSTHLDAWAVLGASAWLNGDSSTFARALRAARAVQPRPAVFYTALAEAAVRQRRYADAVRLAGEAVQLDSGYAHALGVLGTNQLRLGDMAGGRASVERAFALDPFNLWHKNTLDLLDKMRTFRTIRQGRFEVVAPADDAELLALYIVPLLERAYDSLSVRYNYRAPTPVRLEFFRQHADFSVRTVGLLGLGALGVSFGSVLAMDTPNARDRGSFNWGSTAWHELTHAFTLGASAHRVPRWLSEGLSVLEERRANIGWGARTTLPWMLAYRAGRVQKASTLNDGFMRPRYPEETSFSYYQASLFCEWVEVSKGAQALPAMLTAYRDGADTPTAMQRVLGLSMAQVDAQFDAWLKRRFAVELASLAGPGGADSTGGAFALTMRAGLEMLEAKPDSARAVLERARRMFPSYAGDDGPAWYLARVALQVRDTSLALTMLEQVTGRDETAFNANKLEAELRERRGDLAGASAALERMLWIWPYSTGDHEALALIAARSGDHARAIRERRAIIALRPPDLPEARLELARALAAGGDVAAARREVLSLLEEAPSFEAAQALLLELRKRGGLR
ncbi:tetratricopeptide repeat protein [Gemmatimonas sp.]